MPARNISEYPQLLNAIHSAEKIVYLCGAGASMSLGSHRLSWTNWIAEGRKYLTIPEQNELNLKIGSWTAEELIDAATFLLGKLKSSGAYQTFMNQTIGALHPVNTEFKEALCKVWRAGDLIATTNYDTQIEETLNAKGVSYECPAEILSIIRSTAENKVIHLHGMYDERDGIDNIIADYIQYQTILRNSGAQFIQNLIGTNPIIIVGCGGTMEDPNLSGFMSFAYEKLGTSDIPYFYLMKSGDTIPNLPMNAIPVFYGDDYEDLPLFLSEIAMTRLQKRAGLQSVIAVNPYLERRTAISAFGRMHFSNSFNPFVGRTVELNDLSSFLQDKEKFLWRTILGEGGIGKSRLILEWMKTMPSSWFGFFAYKKTEKAHLFVPFADTVVAFDYVLGQEQQCADTIAAFIEAFSDSPYKLRIVLLERHQRASEYDWLIELKRKMPNEARLEFEAGTYSKPVLTIGPLDEKDEASYIENYLEAYLPLLGTSAFIDECKADKANKAKIIQSKFRNSMSAPCLRPLFLSVFIEVWLSKEGRTNLTSTEELLSEYLNKEKKRWKLILGDDILVDSYLRVLSVACIVGIFNITDVQGTNYLAEDCNRLISFFDARSGRPGADNLFEDLFVSVSEQEDDPAQPTLFELLYQQMDKEPQKAESGGSSKSLDQDEKFSLLAPYVKLSADPQEVYLNMRVRGGVATEEEKQKLIQLQNQRTQKEKMLPDHAWLMEPCFPDVINEYIVDYVVNVRDAERFAKLVKSNSVMGFAKFISLALDDWPESDVFQKIAITPPDEELNDSEYYLGLMSRISAIKDIAAVEDVLLEREPIFQRYELELWRRIAIVLTDRGDIRRLYNSGLKYIRFLKEISEKVTIRDEAVDAIEAYCVGLHNAEAVDEYGAFLKKCGELTQLLADNKRIAVICCQNYGRLMHLRLYKNVNAEIQEEWNAIVEILKQCNYDEDVYKNVLDAVEEYFRTLVQRKKEDKLFELERFMAQVYEENGRCEAAEVAALCLANLYNSGGHRKITPDEYETIKKYLQKFPESMHIRAAFIIASEAIYSPSAEYKRVPDKIINKAKQWSEQYPKKIEFQEAYFGLLFSRLKYAQAQDMRNEQRRVYREMKTVAERANYSEYNESNQLMESVDILHRVFGY